MKKAFLIWLSVWFIMYVHKLCIGFSFPISRPSINTRIHRCINTLLKRGESGRWVWESRVAKAICLGRLTEMEILQNAFSPFISFIQKIFIQHILYVRDYAKCWQYTGVERQMLNINRCNCKLHILCLCSSKTQNALSSLFCLYKFNILAITIIIPR